MTRRVLIHSEWVQLEGDITIPKNATGLIAFAHSTGVSGLSPRNREVARALY